MKTKHIFYLISLAYAFNSKGIITIQHTISPTNLSNPQEKKEKKSKIQHTSHGGDTATSPLYDTKYEAKEIFSQTKSWD
jgi:hypothetical protein